jgi:hypothetical protein
MFGPGPFLLCINAKSDEQNGLKRMTVLADGFDHRAAQLGAQIHTSHQFRLGG